MSTEQTRTRSKRATKPTDTTPIDPEAGKEHLPTDYIQLFDKEGQLLWQTSILMPVGGYYQMRDRRAQLVEHLPQILRDMMDASIDMSKLDLSDNDLAGVNFSHLNLAGANLSSCNFSNADLRHADFQGCDLSDCCFDNARCTGLNVTNATLDDVSFSGSDSRYIVGIIMLDELNDYFMWAYPRGKEQLLRIRAGCRDFTLEEALEHWSYNDEKKEPMPGREEIFAALPLIEIMARNRGWSLTLEQAEERRKAAQARGPLGADDDDGDDIMDGEDEE